MSWLLDTCVISELVKPDPCAAVVNWVNAREENTLYLSALTFGELEKGLAKLPDSARRTRIQDWVRCDLVDRFRDRILSIDSAAAACWGALSGAAEARGEPLPVIDSLIAATSLRHDLTVVTRNLTDFKRCGARCVSPWETA